MRGPERFDWFRDEVALDFPSLGSASDRMRASFLATEAVAPRCEAEVRLSPEEAEAGPRVPVQVVVRSPCPSCGGRGQAGSGACPACGGTGDGILRHEVQVKLPSRVRDGARLLYSVPAPRGTATVVDLRVSVR